MHPNPAARATRALGVAAVAAACAAAVMDLAVAPMDAMQGQAQRLMYLHVPSAWLAYLSFTTVFVASVAYLVRRDPRWDRRARAAGELGVGMTALAIALGSLWGRPVWGVWWAWDPRIVTTTVMLLVYVGYLGVRGLSADPDANARRAAVVGVLGAVNVTIVHFSVVWWRTLHQPPTLLQASAPPIDPLMLVALLTSLAAFTVAGIWFFVRRVRALDGRAAAADGQGPGSGRRPDVAEAAAPPIRVTAGGGR